MRAFAPGRVNLIGEHTDYNDGLCLPFAIELGVTVTAAPLAGDEIEVRALDLREDDRFPLGDPRAGEPGGWRLFARGAAGELQAAGVDVPPCRLEIQGDLPRDAGLASSAALCVALALALGGAELRPVELARLCSRVENDWCGARTGLLDQLAALCGEAGHALRLDLSDLSVRPIGLALDGHRLAVLDSGAPRALAASGYNARRAECAAACELLGIASLREARPGDAERLPEPLAGRVRHVTSENERVDAMVAALARADLREAGGLLNASHASLRDDYDASVGAVERTVERAFEAGALGARMVGGGFGGHVLVLLPPGTVLPEGALSVSPGPGARFL